jgi:phosphoglycerate dehydrogenase-like enzyme
MKPTAYLVNASAPPIVNETRRLQALHAGTMAGAGLDVHDIEPLPTDHPFRAAPRTVLTPIVVLSRPETRETCFAWPSIASPASCCGASTGVLNA